MTAPQSAMTATARSSFKARLMALRRDVLTLWFAMRHPLTPWAPKLLAAFTAAYALSPVDLIPDFIPVLGLLDDVILVPLLVAATVRLIPSAVLEDCRREAENHLAAGAGKPVSRAGLIIMISLWVLAALGAGGLWLHWSQGA